jgi:RNA polymerase sigma-70 factor (ECF subfamily)
MTGLGPEAARLLFDARQGSPDALGQILEACRGYLLMIAQDELDPQLQGKGGASDLVQETFLKAQRHFPGFEGTTEGELRAWLRRMLLNNLTDFRRHFGATEKRQVNREVSLHADSRNSAAAIDPSADTVSPSGHAIDGEEAAAVQQALARLPEDYRRVIELRYLEERSFEVIAILLDRTPNGARKLWLRAIERLQQELEAPQ